MAADVRPLLSLSHPLLALLPFAALVAACAQQPYVLPSYFIQSERAVTPKFEKLQFTASVEPHGDRMYGITMRSDQMEAAGFFAFCIAAYATRKAGYPRYVMGSTNPKESVLGRSTLTFPTLLLRGDEKPEEVGPPGYKWGRIVDLNTAARGPCADMLLPEYSW